MIICSFAWYFSAQMTYDFVSLCQLLSDIVQYFSPAVTETSLPMMHLSAKMRSHLLGVAGRQSLHVKCSMWTIV